MNSLIGFVVVLGVLIFFHELGHFILAKAFGVGVEKFSLGFGPKILAKTIGRTEYRLSAIPLGGYVKMVGEQPDEELEPDDIPFSFTHKSVLQRLLIVAAGPVFNLCLAMIIFFGVFWFSGMRMRQPVIKEVKAGYPAESAGFLSGDKVLAINGSLIVSWSELSEKILDSGGSPLEITLLRGNRQINLYVTPADDMMENIFGEKQHQYIIGITPTGDFVTKRLGPIEAFSESLKRTFFVCEVTVLTIVKVFQGVISVKTIGGPILIAQMAGKQVEQGLISLLIFIAWISVNLGILNLLPVPVLDGGHILFFTIEAIIRRPVSIKTREIAQQVGIFLLLMLMVFVFYNDIMRFFEK
jgi:regulator of sigma E protease